jgi:hypothetical protein
MYKIQANVYYHKCLLNVMMFSIFQGAVNDTKIMCTYLHEAHNPEGKKREETQ